MAAEITGASPAFFVPAVDFLHVKFFTVVQVFRPAFLDHGNCVRVFLVFQRNHGLWCGICGGKAIVRNGHKCGKQEYLCKDCRKTFVSTTNTLMANSHQPREIWEAVIDDTLSGDAIDFISPYFLTNTIFISYSGNHSNSAIFALR